jgi:hypothetical protein
VRKRGNLAAFHHTVDVSPHGTMSEVRALWGNIVLERVAKARTKQFDVRSMIETLGWFLLAADVEYGDETQANYYRWRWALGIYTSPG